MSKTKNKYLNVFRIFFKSVKLYFMHLDVFMKYLAFPVFGQIIGVVLLLLITYFYSVNLPVLAKNFSFFDNILSALTLLLVLVVPVFFLLCKAFYDYLIAMAALNSMANNLSSKNKVADVKVHDELIRRRASGYMALLLVLSLAYIVGIIPFFWVILALFSVYSCLSLQVFTFEENSGPITAIKRSFKLIKGNFWSATLLLVLITAFTYWIMPELIAWACDKIKIVYYCSIPVNKYLGLLKLDDINELFKQFNVNYQLNTFEMAQSGVKSMITYAVSAFTLPVRAASCTFLYKQLDDENIEEIRKATKIDGRKEIKKIVKKESI